MREIRTKLNLLYLQILLGLKEFKEDERGMEIIQVLVLLALGLALVGILIAFRDQILGRVQELINDFLDIF